MKGVFKMDKNFSNKIKKILEDGKKCNCTPVIIGQTGPTGPTARCNKSSIYFFKW